MAKGAVQGFKTPVEDHSKSPEWKVEKDREGDETLVGKRIKLWWPVDRRFRYGNINNFDPANNTHKITYDDGEVELLQLVNERWELISGSQKDDLRCPPKGWSSCHIIDTIAQLKKTSSSFLLFWGKMTLTLLMLRRGTRC